MRSIRVAVAVVLVALVTAAAQAAVIRCDGAASFPGGAAVVHVSLEHSEEEIVAGVQNDLGFDPAQFSIAPDHDCAINPAIGPGTDANKGLQSAVLPSGDTVRNIVVSLGSSNPIPPTELYTCAFHVAADTALGEYTLPNTHLVASTPDGIRLPVTGTDCIISVGPTPTPTPRCRENTDCPSGEICVDGNCVTPTETATVTPTPIGFCDRDQDCPDGEVCVDHHCVTPTPTATPIGFCDRNDDCPNGELCVDHHCVTATPTTSSTPVNTATPTATPTKHKSGGSSGCSCEIDPGVGPRAADGLAVLLPALVLLLRRRARRTHR